MFNLFRFEAGQVPVRWRHFQVCGEDASSFLHNQTTNDVQGLKAGQFNLQALVDRVGKVEAHFCLLKADNHFDLYCPSELAMTIQSRFDRFVVSEDVTLRDLGETTSWLALGPLLRESNGKLGEEEVLLCSSPQSGLPIATENELQEFFRWQGIPSLDHAASLGELINQTRLFDCAVSLKKGCFPGQETISKIHYNRGAAWAPVLLTSIPAASLLPDEVVLEGKRVAKIQSQHQEDDVRWSQAELLREMRVAGLEMALPGGTQLKVVPYPRFTSDRRSKAQEFFYAGTEAFNRGAEAGALELWRSAIQMDPSLADAYEAMGVLLGRQGEFDSAIEWMKRLLEVDPTSVMAHTNLSLFLMKQGKIQEAEEHKSLATVASFSAFGREAQAKEAQEAQRKKHEAEAKQREAMFRQVLEIDPEDALANHGLGGLALERGNFSEARDLFLRVLSSDANYAVAYLGLGKALAGLGEKIQAREVWTEGVKVAAKKGEMMPANEMQSLIARLS